MRLKRAAAQYLLPFTLSLIIFVPLLSTSATPAGKSLSSNLIYILCDGDPGICNCPGC